MRSNILTSFFLFLFLLCSAFAAEDFTIYRPQNRPSDELLSTVKGLFSEKAQITSMDEKIIISAPPEITKRILALLNELDKKPGRFRIYVRLISSADLQLEARAVEVSGRAGPIEVNKQSGVLPKNSGGKISVGGISYGASSNSIKGAGSNMQFVDALEGRESALAFGSRELPSGIMVTAKSVGKAGVNLKVKQQDSNGAQVQNLQSEVDIKLNEWRAVGSLSQSTNSKNKEYLGASEAEGLDKKMIQVMVQKIK